MFSRPIDIGRHALIYSGAQKNMGPAGVVVVHHPRRPRAAIGGKEGCAGDDAQLRGTMRRTHRSTTRRRHFRSTRWAGDEVVTRQGGLKAVAVANERKAARLYSEIDRTVSIVVYAKGRPLLINVAFRLATEDRETVHQGVDAAGLDGLKGHAQSGACAPRSRTRSLKRASRAGRIHARVRSQTG